MARLPDVHRIAYLGDIVGLPHVLLREDAKSDHSDMASIGSGDHDILAQFHEQPQSRGLFSSFHSWVDNHVKNLHLNHDIAECTSAFVSTAKP